MKNRSLLFSILFVAIISAMLTACGTKIEICDLTVEQQDGTRALATNQPRFCWQYESEYENVKQVNYRIVVATTEQNARKGIGDLWDSEVIESNQMLYIAYQGRELKSRDKAYWKVYTTVTYGEKEKKVSMESPVKSFEISLLNQDDWQAKWIGHEFDDDVLYDKTRITARYLRKTFNLNNDISKARLYISGLGQYSAYINGTEVAADELLKPAISDYTKRVYFNAYDVTSLLNKGDNAIGVTLEGGRFTTIRYDSLYLEWCGIRHAMHYGMPQLLLQLEVTYNDGTSAMICSDESWKITNNGPIRTANEFDGETYDANRELGEWTKTGYDDGSWLPVELVESIYPARTVQDVRIHSPGASRVDDAYRDSHLLALIAYGHIGIEHCERGLIVGLGYIEVRFVFTKAYPDATGTIVPGTIVCNVE